MLGVPHTEIDSLFHGPNWTPRASFLDDVQCLAQRGAWVTEWQYSSARPLLAARAELMIWLDLPFMTVTLPRMLRRTLRRRVRREVLWNGNIEAPLHSFFTDPEHVVRWAWSERHKYEVIVPRLESQAPDLTIVRLRSQHEIERWLTNVLSPVGGR